jgi:hypothetical protein
VSNTATQYSMCISNDGPMNKGVCPPFIVKQNSISSDGPMNEREHLCCELVKLRRMILHIRDGGKTVQVFFEYICPVQKPAVERGAGGRSNSIEIDTLE